MDDVLARHRKEAKELQGRITGMKKAVGSDKKKKKELPDQIAALESEMKQRHEKEVEALKAIANANAAVDEEPVAGEPEMVVEPIERKQKQNRQQLRKARKATAFEDDRRNAEAEAKNTVNMRQVEDEAIKSIVGPLQLCVKEIVADGHCLYNAVSDQHALQSNMDPLGYQYFRRTAANFMRMNADEFLPYLVNDEGDMLNQKQYTKYCDDVESSATWGGQLEIKAMSSALKLEIHVIQMGSPTVKIGEEYKSASSKPLMLSYVIFKIYVVTDRRIVEVVMPV
ncbi:UNVERIFIED_CONTAM: OTU domain-containing protein 6B [Siphonaria sp. JEL0065]|nr:OTU domain-containing protein 6B [Siphonaria sp. JEL0065]